jgi:Zn finger protein HypA/HybF involved in hydrogenase expression
MGHIQFLNQDGEWESFPTPEQEENLRANALVLEELGYKLICQSCNRYPSIKQIRERYLKQEWTCEKCHTINSAGKA